MGPDPLIAEQPRPARERSFRDLNSSLRTLFLRQKNSEEMNVLQEDGIK